LTMDQIFLDWRNFFKFLLEMASFIFAVGPLMAFFYSDSLSITIAATTVFLCLFVISLVIMRIVEKEMYEVLKGMKRGTIWFNRARMHRNAITRRNKHE